jgi:hypothetical protein
LNFTILNFLFKIDSLNSLSYAESFKTGKSPPFDEDDPFVTPTSPDANFFEEFDARALTPTAAVSKTHYFDHVMALGLTNPNLVLNN